MQKEVVFFARVKTDGTFQTAVGTGLGTIPNPLNNLGQTCTPLRTGAGVYTLTFGTAMPIGEYEYSVVLEGAAANGNGQVSVAGAVATVSTSVGAVATDENFSITVSRVVASQP